jgi:hypothetical protein
MMFAVDESGMETRHRRQCLYFQPEKSRYISSEKGIQTNLIVDVCIS